MFIYFQFIHLVQHDTKKCETAKNWTVVEANSYDALILKSGLRQEFHNPSQNGYLLEHATFIVRFTAWPGLFNDPSHAIATSDGSAPAATVTTWSSFMFSTIESVVVVQRALVESSGGKQINALCAKSRY